MGETGDVEDGLVQIWVRLGFNRVVRVVGWRAVLGGHDGEGKEGNQMEDSKAGKLKSGKKTTTPRWSIAVHNAPSNYDYVTLTRCPTDPIPIVIFNPFSTSRLLTASPSSPCSPTASLYR